MRKIFTIALLLSFAVMFSQHEVAKKIQELEKQDVFFKPMSVFNTIQKPIDNSIEKLVEKATIVSIKAAEVNAIVANKYQNIELGIPYNGTIILLDLYQVNIVADGFHVDTDKQKNNNYKKGVYYRGIVKGDYTSVVSFNFFNNELNGIISSSSLANIVVGKLQKAGNSTDYIIYSDSNLNILNDYKCGYKDAEFSSDSNGNSKSTASLRCVTIYFELDYNLYQSNSSDITATINWMTSVFNNVQTLFSNDGISIAIKSIFIWTTQDPYEGIGTSSSDYLYKFNEVRPVFDGDLGQLVGIDTGGLGGVAVTINGLCNQNNFSYSDVFINYQTVPIYSWTVEVITHELGHLMGSPHTHACIWNGNNTAIDNCASSAQGSSAQGYSCRTTPLTIPSEGGTIMSYCHLVSGVGINLSNGFGIQPANRILTAINGGSCLSTDCVNTCINTISSITIESVTTTSATITFVDAGTSFTSWQIAIYPFGGSISSWITTTTNTYTFYGLNPDSYYVVAIRPDCSSNGLISGGEIMMFVTAASFCDGIVFADSGGTTANYTDMETVVRTIIPNTPNNNIVLTFSAFSLELNYDYLYVYNGNSVASTLMNVGGSTGTIIPGPFVSYAPDGSLTVKFFSDQGVVDSGFIATISCTPSLNTNTNNYIDFSYFPNPTNGRVTINSKTPINQVLVYNVTGQLLYNSEINTLNTNVDISSFAIGTYFFKLKFDGDKEANFKVIRK